MDNFLKGVRLLLLITGIQVLYCTCKPRIDTTKPTYSAKNWINWNGTFKTTTDSKQRLDVVQQVRNEIDSVDSSYPVPDSLYSPVTSYLYRYITERLGSSTVFSLINVQEHYCSCKDTLLWNIQADIVIGGSGGSVPTPPPPPPKTKVSGDPLDAWATNDSLSKPETLPSLIDSSKKVTFSQGFTFDDSSVLAVIDTGIDTLLFDPALRENLLWHGPKGSQNLLIGADSALYNDDHPVKHGTSVATIALNAYYNERDNRHLPKLMVLKALDSTGGGDLFALNCAISYAIRNKASLINASLGFYGPQNSVLSHYVNLSFSSSIPIVAAAGNSDKHPVLSDLCKKELNQETLLSLRRLFYPACYSMFIDSFAVMTVTGLSEPGIPCYFQNYSPQFVTVGLVNGKLETNCCLFVLPFFTQGLGISGSSFATPVVSGRMGFYILKDGPRQNVRDFLSPLNANHAPVQSGFGEVTFQNLYIMN